MEYYREYIEIADGPGSPYVAVVRLCHDFPVMAPTGGNQVAIFDERVAAGLGECWDLDPEMPTESWAVLSPAVLA